MTETEHQILLMCWAKKMVVAGWKELDFLFAIPNGGGRSKREASQLKAAGVKAGVSDLFLPVASAGCHGLWIELKVAEGEGGRVSEEQWKWIYAMRANGYAAQVAFGWRKAATLIGGYLQIPWDDVVEDVMKEMFAMEQRLVGDKGGE